MNTLKSWAELGPDLVAVAMGRKPAETIIKNAKWVNVHSGEIIPNTDIAIYKGRFAYVGPDASHTTGPETKIIDERPLCLARLLRRPYAC